MFDIGFQELLLIGVVSLIIMGPERLPGAVKTASLWIAKFRRSFQQIKSDIEREIGADEIRQQIHNESILTELQKTKDDVQKTYQENEQQLKNEINTIVNPTEQKSITTKNTTNND